MIVLFLMNGAMAQWFPQNSGTTKRLRSVYFTDVNTGYVVGDSGTILKTTNGGTNWSSLSSGTNHHLYSIDFPNANTGYAVGSLSSEAVILKTVDAGTSWTVSLLLSNFGYSIYFRDVFFTDSITGYALGGSTDASMSVSNWIRQTTDGGATWNSLPFGMDCWLGSIYFTNANMGYAVGYPGSNWYQGLILKTIDGGASWDDYLPASTGVLHSIYFTDAYKGYAVGADGAILKTIDGGTTWDALSSGTNSGLGSVFFPDDNTGYALGYNYADSVQTILKTIDSGTNWTTLSIGSSIYLHSIYFTDANTGYGVGENGVVLKTINGGGFPVGINDQNQTINRLTIYPNPAINNITLETTSQGYLSIHNISGQQLLQRTITEPTTTIDVSGWKSGVYLVKVVGEMGVHVGKIVKW